MKTPIGRSRSRRCPRPGVLQGIPQGDRPYDRSGDQNGSERGPAAGAPPGEQGEGEREQHRVRSEPAGQADAERGDGEAGGRPAAPPGDQEPEEARDDRPGGGRVGHPDHRVVGEMRRQGDQRPGGRADCQPQRTARHEGDEARTRGIEQVLGARDRAEPGRRQRVDAGDEDRISGRVQDAQGACAAARR